MEIDFSREIALKILYKIEKNKAYSNIVLDEYLNKYKERIKDKDRGFISEIVYGTTMWKLTIDTIIQKYSKIKISKISIWIMNILRMGVYQIIFLDKVPKSAAVNECVKLSKKYGNKSTGFVNAILRKIDYEDYKQLEQLENQVERLSKLYSMPEWIIEELLNDYKEEIVVKICENSILKPKTTIRVNTIKTTEEGLIKQLNKLQIKYEKTELENFINVKVTNIGDLDLFKEGHFTIQDQSAGLTSIILSPKPGDYVLDCCSAPGGKTTHLAQIMKNTGNIIAWDIYENRLKLVEQNAKRLGIDIIKTKQKDASILDDSLIEQFDKILLDVPCMGLGVLKRKPDIKWQRSRNDIQKISIIQFNILNEVSKYLKRGGELVYSTCSILKSENRDVINKFLKNEKFEIKCRKDEAKEERLILPEEDKDGFYICKLVKK